MVVCHRRRCGRIDGFCQSVRLPQEDSPARPLPFRGFQRGGQFVPPLGCSLTHRADGRCFNAGIPRASSASSSPFPAPRQSPSSAGSRRLATKEFRRSRIPNSEPNVHVPSTKLKATLTTGSKSECAPLPFVKSSQASGRIEASARIREYAILTAEISKAAFGVTPSEYSELKGLKRENLRDHM